MINNQLSERWRQLLSPYRLPSEKVESLFSEITNAYSQADRHYHNLSHIFHIFKELENTQNLDEAIQWATWFHDIVYKPGAKWNERKSAEKAENVMRECGVAPRMIENVKTMILATQNHKSHSEDENLQVFLDADMAILGAERSVYARYLKNIRKEHSSIPAVLFNRGRKTFLKKTLNCTPIFLSKYFKNKYEEKAVQNIHWELRLLS